MKKLKLTIQGMHCGSCAGNIERSLRKVHGVNTCNVSPITNKAFIECSDSVKEDELERAVAKAGYKVVSID